MRFPYCKPGGEVSSPSRSSRGHAATGSKAATSPFRRGRMRRGAGSIPIHPVDLLQPLLHRLFQIVPGPPITSIAAGYELVLLALEVLGLRRIARLVNHA